MQGLARGSLEQCIVFGVVAAQKHQLPEVVKQAANVHLVGRQPTMGCKQSGDGSRTSTMPRYLLGYRHLVASEKISGQGRERRRPYPFHPEQRHGLGDRLAAHPTKEGRLDLAHYGAREGRVTFNDAHNVGHTEIFTIRCRRQPSRCNRKRHGAVKLGDGGRKTPRRTLSAPSFVLGILLELVERLDCVLHAGSIGSLRRFFSAAL